MSNIFALSLGITAIIEEPTLNACGIYMRVKSSHFRLDAVVDRILLKSNEPLKERRRLRSGQTTRAGIVSSYHQC